MDIIDSNNKVGSVISYVTVKGVSTMKFDSNGGIGTMNTIT
ncbi:hypothetical protein [endosymbiont 'TC1' of Trimyema compressum]|nr:hypothetical protein [endosymbiont 'TC1' of Trimyema compressum]